jgi:cytochrome c-type biogenesis protein CcmH/NrfG
MTSHQTRDADVEAQNSKVWRRVESAEAAKLETEVEALREELASEVQNRRLRYPVAIGALALMVIQVAVSNVIFGWYGDTNAWEIPSAAISVWMGTTVVEVIGVVLVVMNYLFPAAQRGDA